MVTESLQFINDTRGFKEETIKRRRVVVTGIGMISPLGLNVQENWSNLIAGKCGISTIDIEYASVKTGGVIIDFKPEEVLKGLVLPKDLRRISRPVQLSTAAIKEALIDAGLLKEVVEDGSQKFHYELVNVDPERIGVSFGTGIGGASHIAPTGERIKIEKKASPFDALIIEPERVASVPSMKFGLKGPVSAPAAACASGSIATKDGYQDIALGDADAMVVGGVESCVDYIGLNIFGAMGALSKEEDPLKASRPFNDTDPRKKGFVMAEGAGALVLEEYEHAKKRGAKIYAELIGYASTSDADHDTAPSGEGAERALCLAVNKANDPLLLSEKIYMNAHGTGTYADSEEAKRIKNVFSTKNIFVSSTKGATGHTIGGAGAIEAIFSVKTLSENILPATINHEKAVAEAEGLDLIPNEARMQEVYAAVNNSFGFGGINCVTIYKRVD